MKRLPPRTRRGKNTDAFLGAFRLWERQDQKAAGMRRAGFTGGWL
jgi:polyphosphate glucokinase